MHPRYRDDEDTAELLASWRQAKDLDVLVKRLVRAVER